MAATVGQILDIVNEIAPPELAESYDNVGLLAGHPAWPVECVLTALDLTKEVVREAEQAGAQLILTHHPVFFRGRKSIREDDTEGEAVCALIRSRKALIAAHTNFDNASPGVNDALADALALKDVEVGPHGLRVGRLIQPFAAQAFAKYVEKCLNARARLFAGENKPVSRVAVLGGAGGGFWEEALEMGADCFVTGEVRYHEALAACGQGLCLLEAGHYETEQVAIKLLADRLQARCDALQYNITVIESNRTPYMRRPW
ncbi:MAG: Nif3-like dinuclear metal center hexameric protein [Clostridia bacterium]|nr:Nif3-like dinuclear metal center hexameric protein [Clostridia bacterium]